jgi:SPOR domain
MTRMSANDRIDDPEHDLYDEAPPRSIFATMWFRALLVLIVLAVVVAVAVPYILDATNPPTKPTIASRPQPTPTPSPPAVTPPPATSSALSTQAEKAPDTTLPAAGKLGSDTATLADKPSAATRATAPEKPVAEKPALAQSDAKPSDKPSDKKDAKIVAAASDVKPKRIAARSTTTTASAPRPTAITEWWVQVGAYREESTARKVAARLREQNYAVEESVRGGDKPVKASVPDPVPAAASTPNPVAVDQYDVFVSGTTTDALSSRLSGRGLTAEASGNGVIVKPSLPLRDAVALSKDLATEGLKVQVRRAGSTGETTIPAADKRRVQAPSISDPLYRVRVGSFSDRETAVATLKELEGKGYKPFIARGGS